ncbi:DEAD/DEAH box helicase [Hoylesella buccalis]|uniref:DEAD/DEAH box helicase n=1 Tax=Hoylesella buccalis TaxID=28127 RepID=UPI0026EF7C35|nr:DEAD/DEAH box helicase [Hoylesella buccalis]
MEYSKFYTDANRTLVNTLLSIWFKGKGKEQEYLREILNKREPLMSEPIFQTVFPWEQAKDTFLEYAQKLHILDEKFVEALADEKLTGIDYNFPANRCPYIHQAKSWENMLNKHKTIVVTTGTGSGKTECFMIPVLQDLYRQKIQNPTDSGVQAIFIYPLNALMKSQQQRINAWCKALDPNITYTIYNGDTPNIEKKEPNIKENKIICTSLPQMVYRQQIRNTPPQIMFTNPTMLNYMLVRQEDQTIIKKSRGKLRWILLDEAHSYSGSAASELALQIRRVIDAFGETVDDVNFAVTSATIGDTSDQTVTTKLQQFVHRLTGKPMGDIVIIDGKRIIPEMNEDEAQKYIAEINQLVGNGKVDISQVKELRERINASNGLTATQLTSFMSANSSMEERLRIIDKLSESMLPTRAHFFIRSINGVYVCTNPDCKRDKAIRPSLGSMTTYQTNVCPNNDCKQAMLEVATCPQCGQLLVVGEENVATGNAEYGKIRMRSNDKSLEQNIFGRDVNDDNAEQYEVTQSTKSEYYEPFVLAKVDDNVYIDSEHVQFATIRDGILKAGNEDSRDAYSFIIKSNGYHCPHCGKTINNALYLRASSSFLSRCLASTLLNATDPIKDNTDSNVIYGGRKYLSFMDNRQGSAKVAMTINQDVERNWARTAIYHTLLTMSAPKELSEDDREMVDYVKSKHANGEKVPVFLLHKYNEILCSTQVEYRAYGWNEIKNRPSLQDSQLRLLYSHLQELNKRTFGSKDNYIDAMFLDQFGWIPKYGNSLETMGLVKLVYPTVANAKVPYCANGVFTNGDWQDFLRICLDYFIRAGRHYYIPAGLKNYLTQDISANSIYPSDSTLTYKSRRGNVESVKKWLSGVKLVGEKGSRQHRIVLLLCAALGYEDDINQAQENVVNTLLREAWNYLTGYVLEKIDNEHAGYVLNLMDSDKVRLQLIDKAWICPVDNIPVTTVLNGYSPRISGVLSGSTFKNYKIKEDGEIKIPYFPYACYKKHEDGRIIDVTDEEIINWTHDNLENMKEKGLFSNLHEAIFMYRSVFLAAEHSAQIDHPTLNKYEKAFNDGHLNILSCSTTMEMGIDIGGIEEVVMNNVPPKPSNYQQRAGRAGRRNETKSIAVTFCAPNPIGSFTWKNPMGLLSHDNELPILKFESSQLVQRHVNSLFLTAFVNQIQNVGVKVTTKLREFFDNVPSKYENFAIYLLRIANENEKGIQNSYNVLVGGTIFDGKIDLKEAAGKALQKLNSVKKTYDDRVSAYTVQLQDTGARQKRAIEKALDNYKESFLLGYLAENGFIPSAGMPTGLVPFTKDLYPLQHDWYGDHGIRRDITQHLSQAISMYSPGHQVVINELAYRSEGIYLKTDYEHANRYVLQRCCNCGFATIAPESTGSEECPMCHHHEMHGLKDKLGQLSSFTEVIEPAGFTVAYSSEPQRKVTDSGIAVTQPLLLEMSPWKHININGSKVVMRRGTEKSRILFYNNGNGLGFALCSHCGRMTPETPDNEAPLSNHFSLLDNSRCAGNTRDNIRRHVLLTAQYLTDIVEMKFYDKDDLEINDIITLYSLGTVITQELTKYLGIRDDEVSFGYNQDYNSIFIFDTALGGAGYSIHLPEYKNIIFDNALTALESCDCNKACLKCLINRHTQWYSNYLDRNKAIEWLKMEQMSRTAPNEIKAIFDDAVTMTGDFVSEISNLDSDDNIESITVFIDSNVDEWEDDEFSLAPSIYNRHFTTNLVSDKMLIERLSAHPNKTAILGTIYKREIKITDLALQSLVPLMLVKLSKGSSRLYFTLSGDTTYNEHWGECGSVYYTSYKFDFNTYDIELDSLLSQGTDITSLIRLKEESCHISDLFGLLTHHHEDKWSAIKSFVKGKFVDISYNEKYLNTPLGCMILANMVKAIPMVLGVKLGSIKCYFPKRLNNSNNWGSKLMDNFYDATERNSYLTECVEQLANRDVQITMLEKQPHFRWIELKGSDFSLSIYPDGGIANGWKLRYNESQKKYDDVEYDENLLLISTNTHVGIQYIIDFHKEGNEG